MISNRFRAKADEHTRAYVYGELIKTKLKNKAIFLG